MSKFIPTLTLFKLQYVTYLPGMREETLCCLHQSKLWKANLTSQHYFICNSLNHMSFWMLQATAISILDLEKREQYIKRFWSMFVLAVFRPELFFGRLSEAPRKMRFEEHRDTASEVGEDSGEFYYVTADSVPLKFSAQRVSGTLDPPLRPARSPASPGGGSAPKFWKRSHGKTDKDFV